MQEPDFIKRDPQQIFDEMVADYEARVGKTLLPAQAETLLIQTFSYRELLLRIGIQDASKQNLLAFSSAPVLDYLGELLGVTRLPATFAQTKLEFTIVDGHTGVTIPSGTRVASVDGKVVFETDESKVVNAGVFTAEIQATAQAAGVSGNDYQPGNVNVLLDPLAFVENVENTTISDGGSEAESDDQLRERIKLVPSTYSNAGSVGAYKFWAASASPLILDVGAPKVPATPGQVDIYPLVEGGVATQEVLDAVEAILNADTVRPLTDTIVVANPIIVNYNLVVDVTLFTNADEASVQAAISTALDEYFSERENKLGQDIVVRQIENVVMNIDGVYDCDVTTPANNTIIEENEFAKLGTKTINIIGREDG